MRKIIGYIIAIIGLIAFAAFLFEPVKSTIDPFLPEQVTTLFLAVGGIVLLLVGIFLIMKGSKPKQKSVEVPIFEGRNIIGYRKT